MTTALVLRCVDKNRAAHGGFIWPESGPVEAPDWDPSPKCGAGLHGWLRGEGDSEASGRDLYDETLLWQVVEVNQEEIVSLDGKVKFPRGAVLFTGPRAEAVGRIQAEYPDAAVIFGTATAGDNGVLVLSCWDGNRRRIVVGYVGEDGIEAGKKYRLDSSHKFEAVP